jgi:uncharacterized protein YdeI (YjbR/CyaY-like superfamily)
MNVAGRDLTFFPTAGRFRAWLSKNSIGQTELLVGFYKVGSGLPSMTWPDAVDEALCFGWIDGLRRGIDEQTYSIRFTPRKRSSIWSAVNIRKYELLLAAGRLTPAGIEAFAHRQESRSRVYAHEQTVSPELSAEESSVFRLHEKAWTYFEACPPGYRKLMLHWITKAKRAPTRSTRFQALLKACAAAERVALW